MDMDEWANTESIHLDVDTLEVNIIIESTCSSTILVISERKEFESSACIRTELGDKISTWISSGLS